MKGVVWFLGALLIVLGAEGMGSSSWHWSAVRIVAAGLWFLVGCGLAFVGLARLAGKARDGAFNSLRRERERDAPSHTKEE